jgi:signal transduction histidine kinase
MMRYIRKHDAQEVENRMYDAGMTPHGWRELLVKSRQETAEDFAAGTAAAGTGTGGTGGSGGSDLPGGIGALAVLLAELDDMMAGEDISPEKVDDTVTEIGKEVERIAEATEQKIEALGVDLEGMMVGEEEYLQTHHAMPQHEFRDLLAEIVQELCQPLSAANCAVNMTLGGHVGEINDKQQDVLAVASRCGKRLDKLLERLKQIVGMPKGLKPDKERVYSKPPKPITPLVQIFDLTPEDEEA